MRGNVEGCGDALDRLIGKGELAHGIDLHGVLVTDSLAGGRHHAADAVDLIAKELDAHRGGRLSGIDVDGVAVHMEKARRIGGIGRGVAHAHQAAGNILERRLLPHRKRGRGPIPAVARRHAAQQSARRGDHDAVLAAGDATQRGASGGDHGVVGRGVFPGIVRALRETRDVLKANVGDK